MGHRAIFLRINTLLITALLTLVVAFPSFGQPFAEELKTTNNLIYSGKFTDGLAMAKDIFLRAEAAGDSNSMASALLFVSDGYYYLGQRELTLPPLHQALQIYEALNDLEGIGRSHYSIAYYYERSDPAQMIEILNTARSFAEQVHDDKLEMNIANATGVALWGMGQYDEAIVALERSIALAQKNQWDSARAACLQNIALIHLNQGRAKESLAYCNEAMTLFKNDGATHSYAVGLGNSGNAYLLLREFENGLKCYEEALTIHRENSYPRGEAINLNCIAGVYLILQEWDKAREYLLEAIAIHEKMGNKRDLMFSLSSLGNLALNLGHFTEARDYFLKSLAVGEPLGDPFMLDDVEKSLAIVAMKESNRQLAEKWLDKAENHARLAGKPQSLGIVFSLRSELAAENRNWDLAIKNIRLAIATHEQINMRTHTYLWHAMLAKYLTMTGDLDGARTNYEASLKLIERIDAMIATDRFRVGLFSGVAQIYHQYASWLARQGEVMEGMAMLDLGRSRVLALRLLQSNDQNKFSTEQQTALNRISLLQRQLRQEVETSAENKKILKLLETAEREYEKASGNKNISETPETHFEMANFDRSQLLISYSAQSDTLLIFSLTRGRASFRMVPDAEAILTRARMYSDLMANPDSGERSRTAGKNLCQILMGPELDGYKGRHILINPDSDLWTFPFVALITQQNCYLGEQVSLGMTPSWNVLQTLANRQAPKGTEALILANSKFQTGITGDLLLENLDSTESEALNVGSHFKTKTFLQNASESTFKKLPLEQFDAIHFATHTLTDVDHPLRSSIVLGLSDGEDGLLQAREIHHLPLDCSLVVVSGCKSGFGKVVFGEGLLGVTNALLRAGSRCVVMSRWDITDEGAVKFMDEFYLALGGHGVSEAVSIAQQKLRESKKWNHPYYWAPFYVAGDGDVKLETLAESGNFYRTHTKEALILVFGLGLLAGIMIVLRKRV